MTVINQRQALISWTKLLTSVVSLALTSGLKSRMIFSRSLESPTAISIAWSICVFTSRVASGCSKFGHCWLVLVVERRYV